MIMNNNSRIDEKEKVGSYRVITQEWLDANGFSPLEDVIKRIESHKKTKVNDKKKLKAH
jgi:hypothetical protein